MPITTVEEAVIAKLLATPTVVALLSTDRNVNPLIRAAKFQTVGDKYPQITIDFSEGKSDSIFPASEGELNITIWVKQSQPEPKKFLNILKELIIPLFNREGDVFNDIDVPTDAGIRFLQFVLTGADFHQDDVVKDYYCEMIFTVNRSRGESFASDVVHGDDPWV